MARSSVFRTLRRLYRNAAARMCGAPVRAGRGGIGRRDLLWLGSGAAASVLGPPARATSAPRIAIVGGGIAGLMAALTLRQAGYRSTIYEASGRIGGRMHSDTTTWRDHQVSEHCGELIDSDHTLIIGLAQHYGIGLTDLIASQPKGSTDTYFFFDKYYTYAQAEIDFQPVFEALTRDANAAGYPTTFDQYNGAGWALDHMSAYDWIERNVPGGHASPMGRLIDVAYDIEFGAPSRLQSALNIVYLLAYQYDPSHFLIFGESDEHYHMIGGNEQVPRAIAADLERWAPGTVRLGARMTSLTRCVDGGYVLGLDSRGHRTEVAADYVILALPFSVLRGLDIARAGFDWRKRRAIDQLGYGSNVKLHLQFDERLWNRPGPWGLSTGETFSDLPYQNTWEVSRGQAGKPGILVDYLGSVGGRVRGDPNDPAFARQWAEWFLCQLESLYPGISALWNGLATLDVPLESPFLRGSYSYWKVGQYTRVAGVEKLPSGRCHFAGEHCSIDYQGYMEGGAEEGVRAGQEVATAIASG